MSNYYLHMLFEADNKEITWWAMTIRGIIIFIYGIFLIKLGGKRMFGREGAFDIVISIMMGALLAKAIAGNGKFFPTIITTLAMSVFYNILSKLAFFNRFTEELVKGKSEMIISKGKFIHDAMKRHNVTEHDIMEVLRNKNKSSKIEDIKEAHVEANGKISIILNENSSQK